MVRNISDTEDWLDDDPALNCHQFSCIHKLEFCAQLSLTSNFFILSEV